MQSNVNTCTNNKKGTSAKIFVSTKQFYFTNAEESTTTKTTEYTELIKLKIYKLQKFKATIHLMKQKTNIIFNLSQKVYTP